MWPLVLRGAATKEEKLIFVAEIRKQLRFLRQSELRHLETMIGLRANRFNVDAITAESNFIDIAKCVLSDLLQRP
jgi:hypothetical protein